MQLFNALSALASLVLFVSMSNASPFSGIGHNATEACVGHQQGDFCQFYAISTCPGTGTVESCLILDGHCETASSGGLYCDTEVDS